MQAVDGRNIEVSVTGGPRGSEGTKERINMLILETWGSFQSI